MRFLGRRVYLGAVVVLREGTGVTLAGIAVGLLVAAGAGQVLQNFLFGVRAVEPLVLVIAPIVLLAASLLASYVPARRATQVDPMAALRTE